ncbi:MAG: hypothetical protein AAF355_01220 [Myxococcota bacterium]
MPHQTPLEQARLTTRLRGLSSLPVAICGLAALAFSGPAGCITEEVDCEDAPNARICADYWAQRDGSLADGATDAGPDPECTGDDECSGPTPVCVLGECVACGEDSDCTDPATPACNDPSQTTLFSMRAAAYTCVGCLGDGDCTDPATPVCYGLGSGEDGLGEGAPSVLTCVACREDSHCGGATPACNNPSRPALFSMRAAAYTCVGCLEDDDCTDPATPVCYGPGSGEDGLGAGAPSVLMCVGCRASEDCGPLAPECNTDTRSCECSASGQCTLAEAARCEMPSGSEPRMCVGCLEDADCGSVMGRPLCLDGGVCVECSTDADCPRDVGGTFVCNPDTYVCTNVESGGTELCQPCAFDTECVNGGLCTEMPYGMEEPPDMAGAFCLPVASQSGTCSGQAPPYQTLLTVGGETLCSINHELTTCEAVTVGFRTCEIDDDCPTGGVCFDATTSSNGQCSYRCDKPEDCASSESCQTDPSDSSRTVCF